MPKYIVTQGSQFNPFTYDELAKPIVSAQERYDAADEAFNVLNETTATLKNYITDNDDDSEAKRMYNAYMDMLTTAQNNLSENGLDAQTKKDLAKARSMFASDIKRISSAIENRQKAVASYNEKKQANPNLIMGYSPNVGLNAYLKDDNFGTDWYSTDGTAFRDSIFTTAQQLAKNRMSDLSKPEVIKENEKFLGYLTRVLDKGFSTNEVNIANALVDQTLGMSDEARKKFYENNEISEPVQLLVDAFMNKYETTGAANALKSGRLSKAEHNRLVDFGKAGFIGGILEPNIKDFKDLAPKLSTVAGDKNEGKKYGLNGIIVQEKSFGYDKLMKGQEKKYEAYGDTGLIFNTTDNRAVQYDNPWEASDAIYYTDDVKNFMKKTGLDIYAEIPSLGTKKEDRQHGTITDVYGNTYNCYTAKLPDEEIKKWGLDDKYAIAVIYEDKNGKAQLSKELSIRMSKFREKKFTEVNEFKEANQDKKLDDVTITPKQIEKYRKDYNIPGSATPSEIYNIIHTKEYLRDAIPATVISSDGSFDNFRTNIYGNIVTTFTQNERAGNISKSSPLAFYEVNEGKISDKGETNITKVMGEKPKRLAVANVSIKPEDVVSNDGRIKVRLTNSETNKVWLTDGSYLGNDFLKVFTAPQPDGFNAQQQIGLMMLPLQSPEQILEMNSEEQKQWATLTFNFLNPDYDGNNITNLRGPIIHSPNGTIRLATPSDILSDKSLQALLYDAVVKYINGFTQTYIKRQAEEHPVYTSNTGKKASTYKY